MTTTPTVDVAARILGEPVALDDPAEAFLEASRLAPSTVAVQLAGSLRLAADPLLQVAMGRSSRRRAHLPSTPLSPARVPTATLRAVLRDRASGLRPDDGSLRLGELSTLLGAAYSCCPRDGRVRRPVPSAGGLYPLELYVVAHAVAGVEPGIHHYDPFEHRLELVTAGDVVGSLRDAVVDPQLALDAAATVVVTAVFPRSRFKYGARGVRFALLETGHVAQNVLLTAHALRVSALPYGGFYDARLDALLDVDGIDETSLYMLFLGGRL